MGRATYAGNDPSVNGRLMNYSSTMRTRILMILPVLLAGFFLPETKRPPQGPHTGGGPYVLYKNGQVYIHYIQEEGDSKTVVTDSAALADRAGITMFVATGRPGEFFTVKLKNKLQNERSVYRKAARQLALSDIEGNLLAFLKLLKANKVIDEQFNWTFGDGHLVLTGDFFDRGEQVTELLWFIYSLEEKAKDAGGYVHFVLGNHEVMNLNGDFRYVHPKYMEHAALLQADYLSLFNENTELGRWLRTKNVMEKVGDVLYVHGGVSEAVNLFDMPLPDINALTRPWYGDTSYVYPNVFVEVLYSEAGPFWYRGYYTGTIRATAGQIDSTLQQFGVRYIATGHTIAADTISTWFNKRLFNTDVPHSKGFSEALLIEKNTFYRVNAQGEKFRIAG